MNKFLIITLLIFFSVLSKGQQKTLWFQCRLGWFEGHKLGRENLCIIDSLAGVMKQSKNQFLISYDCSWKGEGRESLIMHVNKALYNEFHWAGVDANQLVLPDKPLASSQVPRYNLTIYELKK